ncbi:hypothetical protein DXG03_002550 [Asterophora parasitica]|uniref:Arf-GAP domain-containing protein n=1 Tax=Asterophora parasitica TaxID=117018 RepID=A0A9P7G2T2_9AGAR|nr:hypothetical protein DXG03_002550 [Asterophora parasitica]
MSRQDRATTERFTRTLRELVKRPENKVCADCKRNDPRWASWNIGVFLCIRCSGIHRGMGTHISKVKSVDLDTWTPEQMESIQKWGNHLANLYWEAHLKPGHVPPEHKMESFVRSKYESRRWALDGPPPSDPSTLANGQSQSPSTPAEAQPSTAAIPPAHQTRIQQAARPTHTSSPSLSRPGVTSRQPQAHQLLSSNYTNTNANTAASRQPAPNVQQAQPAPAAAPVQPPPANDLFSLDFHAPPPTSTSTATSSPDPPKKDVKQDILSLFSSPPVHQQPQFAQQASPWATAAAAPVQAQATSMLGTTGVGAWGASSGWGAPAAAAAPPPAQNNLWGSAGLGGLPAGAAPPHNSSQAALFNTTAVWGAPAAPQAQGQGQDLFGAFGAQPQQQQKKDDVFGDLWGGFK